MADDLELRIAKLELNRGDILVIKAPMEPRHDVLRHILPPGVRTLFIPLDVELSVLTKAEIDAKAA